MISIMSNSSINKNDTPSISTNINSAQDISLHSNLNTSSTLGSVSNNSANNNFNSKIMNINSNSCLNSLESAQLKKLKKSRYSINQQEQNIHQEPVYSASKQLTHLVNAKPERVSPTLLSTFSRSSSPPPILTSSVLTNNSSFSKQEYDFNSNSNSPSLNSSNSNGSATNFGDQRTMDAADTLVSLAHSASSTPTIESKSFVDSMPQCSNSTTTTTNNSVAQQSNDINNNIEIIVNTSNDDTLEKTSNDETLKSNKEIVESACKLLIQQVLKSYPSINLSSITIKTTASPVTKPSHSPVATVLSNDNETSASADAPTNLSMEITKTSTIQLKTLKSEKDEKKSNGNSQRPEKLENLDKKQNSVTNLLNTSSLLPSRTNSSLDSKLLSQPSQQQLTTSNFANINQDIINAQNVKLSLDLQSKSLNRKTLSQIFSPTTPTGLKNISVEAAAFAANLKFASDLIPPSRNQNIFANRKLSDMYHQGAPDSVDSPVSTSYDFFVKSSQSNESFLSPNNNVHLSPVNKKSLKRKLEVDSCGLIDAQSFSSINGLNKSISSINTISDNEEDSFNGYDEEEDRLNEKENERSFSSDSLSNSYSTGQNRNRSKSPTNNSGLNTSFSLRPAPTLATGRKSKDTELPPDEARKRQDRRERNKEAAARCRRKREDLTISLTRKTEELSREADHLKRKNQELSHEKVRLENLLFAHEKNCISSLSKSNLNATSTASNNNITTNSNNNNSNFFQQQQLLKIKKEELDDIIKQSQDRKAQKIFNQLNNFNSNNNINTCNNNFNVSPSQSGKMNGHLNLDSNQQLNKTPSHCSSLQEAFNNAYNEKHHFMSNSNSNSFHNHHLNTYHHSQTTAIVTPNSATQLENLLSHFEMAKKSPSSEAPHTSFSPPPSLMSQSTGKSPTFLQRPNNLSLKHQQQSTNFPNSTSPSSLALMQNIAYNIFNAASSTTSQHNPIFNSANLNLLMTPTLQLNTPTLYTITPIDSNLYSSSFNNCNTPVIQTSQQFMQNQNNYIPQVTQNQSNKTNNSDANSANIKA